VGVESVWVLNSVWVLIFRCGCGHTVSLNLVVNCASGLLIVGKDERD
jgi:hypothetical protein